MTMMFKFTKRWVSITASFVLTILVVTCVVGLQQLWDAYSKENRVVREHQVMVSGIREWNVLVQWSAAINNTLLASSLPAESIRYFVDFNRPAIDKITGIRTTLGVLDKTPHGKQLLIELDARRDQWLKILQAAIEIKLGLRQVEDPDREDRALRSLLIHHSQEYTQLLAEYEKHVHALQHENLRQSTARLAILLVSMSFLGIVAMTLIVRRVLEEADKEP
jgi:hypothetical protein